MKQLRPGVDGWNSVSHPENKSGGGSDGMALSYIPAVAVSYFGRPLFIVICLDVYSCYRHIRNNRQVGLHIARTVLGQVTQVVGTYLR